MMRERKMGFEPTAFCMASRCSGQLSYFRVDLSRRSTNAAPQITKNKKSTMMSVIRAERDLNPRLWDSKSQALSSELPARNPFFS